MKADIIGQQADLKTNSPLDMTRDHGSATVQNIGTMAPLKTEPMSMVRDSFAGGQIQSIGTKVDLDRTPHHGWNSGNTPMSKRTEDQSKGGR